MSASSAAKNHVYRPDIDGLRAIAVLAVLLFHADVPWITGGYVGVDVFFVISGYLITSIIVGKVDAGTFSIVDFWERRVRRIIPALMVVALFTLIGSWLLFFPQDFKDFSESLIAISVFASNMLFWSEAGYFASPGEVKPLLHTWSLAIEEQFYLLFPLLMIGLAGKRSRWRLPVLLGLSAASFAVSISWVKSAPDSAFYLLPSRAWELAIGSMLVFLASPPQSRILREALCAAGLFMILYACFSYDSSTRFPGAAALLPCIGTALLIAGQSQQRQTLSFHLLSLKPMVFVGLLSYSLYLWHWPIIVFAKYHADTHLQGASIAIVLGLSFALAYCSYRWVETPVRQQRIFATRRSVFTAAAVAFATTIGIGAYGHLSNGAPQRIDKNILTLYSGFNYINPRRKECVNFENTNFDPERICKVGPATNEPAFLVFGDSHADALMPVIDAMAAQYGVAGLYGIYNGCPPLLDVYRYDTSDQHNCNAFNEHMLAELKSNNIKTVLLVGRWAFYPNDKMIARLQAGGQRPSDWTSRPAGETAALAFAEGLTSIIEQAATKADVWVLQQPPLQHEKTSPRYLASKLWLGESVETLGVSLEQHRQRQQFANQALASIAAQNSAVKLLDPESILCDKSLSNMTICPLVRDGGAMYRDDDHLSSYGSMFLQPLFAPMFDSLAAKPDQR